MLNVKTGKSINPNAAAAGKEAAAQVKAECNIIRKNY